MIRLTNEQLYKVSDIASQVGTVAFGSAILPSIANVKVIWMLISLLLAFTFWYWSVIIIKIANET